MFMSGAFIWMLSYSIVHKNVVQVKYVETTDEIRLLLPVTSYMEQLCVSSHDPRAVLKLWYFNYILAPDNVGLSLFPGNLQILNPSFYLLIQCVCILKNTSLQAVGRYNSKPDVFHQVPDVVRSSSFSLDTEGRNTEFQEDNTCSNVRRITTV